jgi:hypothetical protein
MLAMVTQVSNVAHGPLVIKLIMKMYYFLKKN